MHRLCIVLVPFLAAADWPRFLGPTGDAASTETGILTAWPKTGLKKLWDCKLGVGYAPPVVAGGKVFHFDRFGDANRLTARDAATGKELWRAECPTDFDDLYGYDPGPRCSPTAAGGRVFGYGPEGTLFAVDAATGKELWRLDTKAKYRFHQNFFGVGSAPLEHAGTIVVAVGGSPKGPRPEDLREAKSTGTCIVGLDAATGAVKYECGNDLASYASPTVANIGGQPVGLYFARGGLFGFDPAKGGELFRYPWRARLLESVNAANPVIVGDRVLVSESYTIGSAVVKLTATGPQEVWTDRDKDRDERSLLAHFATPVHHAGFVYGCSSRHSNDADLRCLDFNTGEVKWVQKRTRWCSLVKVDGHLLMLAENGELRLLKLNSQKYDEVARWEVPELDYPAWAPPVLADGRLYLRGKSALACYELIPKK